MKRTPGFTMAEVLITLGIIGIVAAMTLPTVINRANHYVLKQQFKKVYNTYSNALLKIYAENGAVFDCYYTEDNAPDQYTHNSQCVEFTESFLKTLNVIQKCENNAYEKGCVPKYKGVDTIYKEQHGGQEIDTTGCSGFWENNILNKNTAYVLGDGSIIVTYFNSSYMHTKIFLVDINGHKKPNKWGHDLFVFEITGNDKRVYLGYPTTKGGCNPVEDNGMLTAQMIEEIYRK